MKILTPILGLTIISLMMGCSKTDNSTTMIDNRTFVHDGKVFQVYGNSVVELADLQNDSISQLRAKPKVRTFRNIGLSIIKSGATATITTKYRTGTLYFKLIVDGIPDIRDEYTSGTLNCELCDDDGFSLQSIIVNTSELIGLVKADGSKKSYEYSGHVEMNPATYEILASIDISSSIRERIPVPAPAPYPYPY